jgi:hypothetical protein
MKPTLPRCVAKRRRQIGKSKAVVSGTVVPSKRFPLLQIDISIWRGGATGRKAIRPRVATVR